MAENNSWMSIADHTIRRVRQPIQQVGDPWTNLDYLIDHTPPALLFARLEDLANRYLWESENDFNRNASGPTSAGTTE